MFETLPERFRTYDLKADVRTLMILRQAIDKGLVKTLGDVYNVLKGIVVKDPEDMGPFTRAYYDYFLNIDIENGDTLSDAIARSETFRKWRDHKIEKNEIFKTLSDEEQINHFLDDVHLSQYDIKEIIAGRDIFDKNPGDKTDGDEESMDDIRERLLNKMADYSDMSLEELLDRLDEIAEQQKTKHSGGDHWIGTGGISPYGHGGAAKDGIRIGGTGGGKMARMVMNDRKFFPVDMDSIINDDNVDAALASLKGVIEDSAQEVLDVNNTIKNGLKRGGLFLPEIKNLSEQKLQVILLIDNGGYSMDPYVYVIRELFKKMKTRFAHDLETYYFHNTIYDRVYTDVRRRQPFMMDRLLSKDPNYKVFVIGDASMAPYELNRMSLRSYFRLKKKFKKVAWLNPEPEKYWHHTYTLNVIKQMIDMYPLTPRGIEKAVLEMNKKSK